MPDLINLAGAAWASEQLPLRWLEGDDSCDCMYQRIGEWKNPYLGSTHQIRLCCVWAELGKLYPQFVQDVPVYWDNNQIEPVHGPQQWDSEEMDMPLGLWYRQLAVREGRPLAEVREEYKYKQNLRPKKVSPGAGRESKQPDARTVRMALLDRLVRQGWRPEDAIAVFERQDREEQRAKGR